MPIGVGSIAAATSLKSPALCDQQVPVSDAELKLVQVVFRYILADNLLAR